jgi:transaldolase
MEADVRAAAEVFHHVYEETGERDGFVSIEVSPHLAYDTEATLEEARRMFAAVDRPNVMVKIPATEAGIPAIRELISEGRDINITLMFSLDQYEAVSGAYLSGLERFAERGGDLSRVASVASFFVSRIDSKVDRQLDAIRPDHPLRGWIGIANAKMAYRRFQERFDGPRWIHLSAAGARPQRPLWASTSVKDPDYPDTMYVDGLIGPDTVNTLPLKTFMAFIDHGTAEPTLETGVDEAQRQLDHLAEEGIDLDEITTLLVDEGVRKFAESYDALMETVEAARRKMTMSA